MESAAYYPSLDDRAYMARFDVEATYRLSADVLLGYFNEGHTAAWASTPPVPFAQKEAAIAYLSSNCGAPSGRDAIVGDLMALPDALPVHALGACRNNRPSPPSRQQVDTLKNYRFCIAMENSIADDYVSEKVYAALVAGCLPIYYGPANAADFVPSPDSIIDWRRFNGSARALMDEVTRLNGDEAAYAATQAWRTQPPESWSPAFRALRARLGLEETQCHQCRLVAEKRASGWRKDN
jgi:alpha-1,3-fucosyltransferase 10